MINARKYNYSNLNVEDRFTVLTCLKLTSSVKNLKESYESEEPSSLEKGFYDTAIFVSNQILQNLQNNIVEFMVKQIDSYHYEVNEIDTDDYFYGLKIKIE